MTKFWLFHQNNSGGSFDIDNERGIGPRVWVEADDKDQALKRAMEIGIYFDGVSEGIDCPCCGDRWSSPWDDEGKEKVETNPMYDFGRHNMVYVHHIDGTIERIRHDKETL